MELRTNFFDQLSVRELYEIVRARQEVFLMEQRIVCRDFDGVDYDALHCFLWEDGRVIAYTRAFMQGDEIHLGRFLTTRHGEGLGKRLMDLTIPAILERFDSTKISFHAQRHAEGFYERFGFETVSEVFLEEGIEHVVMEREFW